MLDISNLSKSYPTAQGELHVLRGIGFSLKRGGTLALTGESGSGKSTLMHLIAGLEPADSGAIRVSETEVTTASEPVRAALRRDTIGLVFQQFNLIPSLNVADNMAFQARLCGRFDTAWQAALSERLGLTPVLRHYPEQLSGGQQQRVAIGRAVASRPALILADEPTGNLDEATGDAVFALLRDLVAETGAALVLVTHSIRLAEQLDRRMHLHAGHLT